eukprot:1136151-Pelagomonas_calceolata.AAC.4
MLDSAWANKVRGIWESAAKTEGERWARPGVRWLVLMRIHKRLQAAVRVSSNVDRGPLARKRDVAFIYHTNNMNELQKQSVVSHSRHSCFQELASRLRP